MATPYELGTVTTTAASVTVTGSGTSWLVNTVTGGVFSCLGIAIPIQSIESDTSLTLAYAWTGTTGAGRAYAIQPENDSIAKVTAALTKLQELLAGLSGMSVNGQSLVGAANYAAMRTLLDVPAQADILKSTTAVGVPALTDYMGVLVSGVLKKALLKDTLPISIANLFKDGGRFAGVPDSNLIPVTSYVAPTYFNAYNGAVFSAGPKFIHNNTTYGGSVGALDASIHELIQLMRPGTLLRYGNEFFIMNGTAGAGTASPVNISGTIHYLTATSTAFPLPPLWTLHYWFKAVSGSVGIYKYPNDVVCVDGVALTGPTSYSDNVWHRIDIYTQELSSASYFYTTGLFRFNTTPGTVFQLAAPVFHMGWSPKNLIMGVIPSDGAVR